MDLTKILARKGKIFRKCQDQESAYFQDQAHITGYEVKLGNFIPRQ